jgi:predicted O-methyltransferase YrrM
MPLQQVVKNVFARMGYRIVRESTYQGSVADEARQMARREAKRLEAEATTDSSLRDEEYFLRELVEEANAYPGPIIEIGTLFGRTTSKIALWKQSQKKIVTVDNYCWNPLRLSPEMHFHVTSLVLQYLKDAGHVVQVRGDKDEWFSRYDGEAPAMVFCDADHSYEATARDIEFALKVAARIVCGHDYSAQHPGTMRAVDEHGGPRSLRGTVWVLQPSAAT